MNTTLKYIAVIFAFASATFAFTADATWAGILAVIAGVLVAVTIIKKEPR